MIRKVLKNGDVVEFDDLNPLSLRDRHFAKQVVKRTDKYMKRIRKK